MCPEICIFMSIQSNLNMRREALSCKSLENTFCLQLQLVFINMHNILFMLVGSLVTSDRN